MTSLGNESWLICIENCAESFTDILLILLRIYEFSLLLAHFADGTTET